MLHLMALVCFNAKQFDHAVEWTCRAIAKDPKPLYLTTLGTALLNEQRHNEAIATFEKAIQLTPNDADSWKNLGIALVESQRPADAILAFQHAVRLNPQHWEASNNAALLLYRLERMEEALTHFNLCDKLQPNHAPTLQMRALTLHNLQRLDEALIDSGRALDLDPSNADTRNNIRLTLQALGRNQDALTWFDQALELRPNHVETLNNKASSLAELRRIDEAFAIYQQAKTLDPGHFATHWNLALLQMLTGNFEAGWAGREARWSVKGLPVTSLNSTTPTWLHVAQQHANRSTLRGSLLARMNRSIFQDARFQPTPDQADQARIADSMFDKSEHPVVIEAPEEVLQIRLQYPANHAAGDDLIEGRQGVMGAKLRPAAERAGQEVLLVDAGQHLSRGALERPVGDSWNPEGALLRLARLGDIDPPNVRRAISLAVDGLEHRLYPALEALLRRLHRLTIHPSGGSLRNLG
jgi:tetratricopeptide (TPR) repeat protein